MPTRKLWNHTINIKEDFVLRKRKIYPLSTAPIFFVGKKNEKKCIVQNYRYLNKWTIKNSYSLFLISNIIENIDMKRVFTKMDLRQGY